MEEILNGYKLLEPLRNKDAGFSRWTYAAKGGKAYFIKEFLDPVFPQDDKIGEEQMNARRSCCLMFERKRRLVYEEVNKASDGNLVRIEDFFRKDSRYYIAMQRIFPEKTNIPEICSLPLETRMQLCRVIAHSMAGLHRRHVVHADIKDKNILIKKTAANAYTAKIIDFDCSFREDCPPEGESELGGDQIYLSPEACLFLFGEEVRLTTKVDVFSLGILFHQYLTGYVPWYDTSEYDYLHEAVLDGKKALVSDKVPPAWRGILERMLIGDPEERCSMEEVCSCLIPGYGTQPEMDGPYAMGKPGKTRREEKAVKTGNSDKETKTYSANDIGNGFMYADNL